MVTQVFYTTIGDVNQIILSDGAGDRNTPFAIRSSLDFIGVKLPGKYTIFVGDAYGKSLASKQLVPGEKYTYAELLIHEVTHVWQYEHGYNVVANSLTHRVVQGESMYDYDETHFLAWDDYNVEQQANIVEHWYHNGMKSYNHDTGQGDIRYIYVEQNIRGERRDTMAPLPPPYIFDATRPDPPAPVARGAITDPLAELMAPRYRQGDPAALERVERLKYLFLHTSHPQRLLARITARKAGDKGVQDFFHVLHPATIQNLLNILKRRA